jgi:hypothetical protein
MTRLFVFLIVVILPVAGAYLLLSPIVVQATQQPPLMPDYRLNSEGDEWILVDPDEVEPKPPVPAAVQQGESEERAPALLPSYLPPSDVQLGIALDQAREAGPEAVLAFVAGQPDPHQPLLEAALRDAQNDLSTSRPYSPSAPTIPRVSLNSGPCAFETIQAAVNAAVNGNTVRVAAGVYTESIDIIGKVITIEGGYDSACTSLTSGLTQVHASVSGSVVDVSGASVLTLRNLNLTGGTSFGAGVDVLGGARVTLSNTDVHGNAGSSGGGMYVGSTSVITYTNDSDIYSNTATGYGGGAIIYGRLSGFISSSDVYQNSAVNGGGIAVFGGTVQLDNADVVANTASNFGGGFFVSNGGVITLTNSVFVGETAPCCQSAATGGGIYANASHVFLVGSATSVLNNTATNAGGGLYLINGSTLTATGGSLGYDSFSNAGNDAVLGAGMYAITSTVDFSGRIINNIASNSGGGLYGTNSTITLTNATVGGAGVNLHNRIGPSGLNGAGMYLINNTHAWLDNTVVISNTLSNPATGYAGGIYVRDGSAITMTNSRVERHFLPSTTDGRGAGLYIYNATVTLNNTQVISNTASDLGGGARLFGTSTLNVLGGASFINNKALNGEGGAVAATNTPDINVTNAILQQNSASGDGGAIYLNAGTLDFTGTWDVRFNDASGNGGAVAVLGTGDVDFSVTAGPSTSYLAVNHASGNGGALYVTNADIVQLYATSGYLLALNTNSAGGNGGFGYANGGALFDVYGKVQATSNSAAGNGGVFYLSNASRLWVDDFFNDIAQIWVNTAANGGAIYASDSPRVEFDGVEFGGTNNGNKATTGSGGAIYLSGSTLLADNCTFRNNQAQAGNGGAIAAYTSTITIDTDYPVTLGPLERKEDRSNPSAQLATACDPLLRQCSSLYLNTATNSTVSNGNGGAIFANGSSLTVSNTYLHRNTAQRGGAIYQEGASAIGNISNTLVYSNTSLLSLGAGIRVSGGAMTVTHATLANNTGGAGYSPGAVQSYVYNTIIWGNTVAAFGSLTAAVCNIDQGGTAGPASNPRFVSPGAGEDYRLLPGSPAIDACSTGLPRDLINVARPIGPRFDMGVYEMFVTIYLPVILR